MKMKQLFLKSLLVSVLGIFLASCIEVSSVSPDAAPKNTTGDALDASTGGNSDDDNTSGGDSGNNGSDGSGSGNDGTTNNNSGNDGGTTNSNSGNDGTTNNNSGNNGSTTTNSNSGNDGSSSGSDGSAGADPIASTPIAFVNTDNVSDEGSLKLNQAIAVAHAKAKGETQVFVAGYNDSGLSSFSFADDGTLTSEANLGDNPNLALGGVLGVSSIEFSDYIYLFTTAYAESGVGSFYVEDDKSLGAIGSIFDTENLNLRQANGITTLEHAGTIYVLVTGLLDDGVSAFKMQAGGLANTSNFKDSSYTLLDQAAGITTAEVGGNRYVFVASHYDEAVTTLRLDDEGRLLYIDTFTGNEAAKLYGAAGVTTAQVGSETYLFVASYYDDGVSAFRIRDNGVLVNVDNVRDNGDLNLNGAWEVATAEVGGRTYLFVAGRSDNGVSVFLIEDDGDLIHKANINDNDTLNLGGATDLDVIKMNGETYLLVVGVQDSGVSVFRVEPPATP